MTFILFGSGAVLAPPCGLYMKLNADMERYSSLPEIMHVDGKIPYFVMGV
ncbi:hypothetical protein [Alkalihalobacillus pseudalcaliphilus]|nr:hypothetical protein [Alkalihalobacillus pseudalcaliphilus]